jgi:hypothetical protein
LIYLTRSTDAPHDMAVLFASRFDDLRALSEQVIHDPHVCDATPLGCFWIPAGHRCAR